MKIRVTMTADCIPHSAYGAEPNEEEDAETAKAIVRQNVFTLVRRIPCGLLMDQLSLMAGYGIEGLSPLMVAAIKQCIEHDIELSEDLTKDMEIEVIDEVLVSTGK